MTEKDNYVVKKKNSYIRNCNSLVEIVQKELVDKSVVIKDWREHADLENNTAYIELIINDCLEPENVLYPKVAEKLEEVGLYAEPKRCDDTSIYIKPNCFRDILDYHRSKN